METLTQKQENFVLNLFKGMSQRDAYIKAGYSSKQSMATIDNNAYQLAKNSEIVTRYKELQQAAKGDTIATVVERKQVLTEIIRGRFIDFMTHLTPEKLKSAALQEIRITEFTGGKDGRAKEKTTTIKLYPIIQAIDTLNKMERLYEAEGSMFVDNRTLIINVQSEKSRSLTERLMEGERTGGEVGQAE